jgi:hypothetical protein
MDWCILPDTARQSRVSRLFLVRHGQADVRTRTWIGKIEWKRSGFLTVALGSFDNYWPSASFLKPIKKDFRRGCAWPAAILGSLLNVVEIDLAVSNSVVVRCFS